MAAPQEKSSSGFSIKTIWGLAKSPELSLDKDTLYTLMERETGKDSMRQLTQQEIDRVCRELIHMKELARREAPPAKRQRRTDEGGNPGTVNQRRYIYVLTRQLGWKGQDSINSFVRRIFKIDRLEWLSPEQCRKLIEILKQIQKRTVSEQADADAGREEAGISEEKCSP